MAMDNKIQYDESIKELVVKRLETLPDGAVISIGSGQEFNKEELIKSIREGNDIGQKIIEIELSFLQSLKNGVFYGGASTDN